MPSPASSQGRQDIKEQGCLKITYPSDVLPENSSAADKNWLRQMQDINAMDYIFRRKMNFSGNRY